MKRKIKKIPISKVQIIFNKYIRERDSKDGYFTCISCGRTKTVREMNAGHYVPVRCSYLRFNEWNVNGECISCNGFDGFHLIGYRKNLIEKIGLDAVEWLERMREEKKIHQWKQNDLVEIMINYK